MDHYSLWLDHHVDSLHRIEAGIANAEPHRVASGRRPQRTLGVPPPPVLVVVVVVALVE